MQTDHAPHGGLMNPTNDEPTDSGQTSVPTALASKPVKFMGRLDGSCELPEFEPGELVTITVGDQPPVTFRAIGNRK